MQTLLMLPKASLLPLMHSPVAIPTATVHQKLAPPEAGDTLVLVGGIKVSDTKDLLQSRALSTFFWHLPVVSRGG